MAIIKNVFLVSLLILTMFLGFAVGGTVHKVGDSKGWTMMGGNYESWSASRTFKVGDSLVFKYNKEYHDVTQVTPNNFEMCEPSKSLARYQTGFDTITLTKPGVYSFICGVPGHCEAGQQKLRVIVLPTSLGPVAAPLPRPVRSPTSSPSSPLAYSPVSHASNSPMGPSPAPHNAASSSSDWIGFWILSLLCFLIFV